MELATGQAPWVAYIQVSEKAVCKKMCVDATLPHTRTVYLILQGGEKQNEGHGNDKAFLVCLRRQA